MLSSALRDTKRWQVAYHNQQIDIAVNLSPSQLKSEDLVEFIASQLQAFDFDPEYLEIEITEGILLSEKAANVSKLIQIKALGVKLSMDDFGKGYSSLSYLRNYPFDVIKIDKEFIDDVESNASHQKLIITIIALGKSMGLTVIAEGVETRAQLDFLKAQGCNIAQGFLFSPAVPAEGISAKSHTGFNPPEQAG